MKKHILSIISFCLIFALIFCLLQSSFYQRLEGRYVRSDEYKNLSDEDLDVLAFGTSELWAGYDPIVTYHEQGITGYNLTTPFHSAVTTYYQLCQALEYHTPKIVLCDFCSLFEDNLPSESSKIERLYYEAYDNLDSLKLKFEMLKDIKKIDKDISVASYMFPLVRYHSMWNELGGSELVLGRDINRPDIPYKKGARLESKYYGSPMHRISPENWNYDEEKADFSELSVDYYDRFIKKCREKGITVVAVNMPKPDSASEVASRLNAQVAYLSSRNVYLLNYNTYEQFERLGLDLERDYYDYMHMNTLGSVKFSKALANDMRKFFDIPDRRTDPDISSVWDNAYEQFEADMLDSQPTIRHTVGLAREFGYNVFAEIASDSDNIWSGEFMQLNKEYGYTDKLKPGYYVYDNENMDISFYEYDCRGDEESVDTSIGTITRDLYGEDYKVHVALNGNEMYSEAKAYYVYIVSSPMFSTKLAVVDGNSKVHGATSWEYDFENGNSSKADND